MKEETVEVRGGASSPHVGQWLPRLFACSNLRKWSLLLDTDESARPLSAENGRLGSRTMNSDECGGVSCTWFAAPPQNIMNVVIEFFLMQKPRCMTKRSTKRLVGVAYFELIM